MLKQYCMLYRRSQCINTMYTHAHTHHWGDVGLPALMPPSAAPEPLAAKKSLARGGVR